MRRFAVAWEHDADPPPFKCPTDAEAWNLFVQRYGGMIYGWCCRYGLQDVDAQDVTQNVFIALIRHLRNFDRSRGLFRNWLHRIVQHRVSDWCNDPAHCHERGTEAVQRRLSTEEARRDLETRLNEEFDLELLEVAEQNSGFGSTPQPGNPTNCSARRVSVCWRPERESVSPSGMSAGTHSVCATWLPRRSPFSKRGWCPRMIARTNVIMNGCPQPKLWMKYLRDQVSLEQDRALTEHAQQCPACEETLARLVAPNDPPRSRAADSPPPELVESLRGLWSTAFPSADLTVPTCWPKIEGYEDPGRSWPWRHGHCLPRQAREHWPGGRPQDACSRRVVVRRRRPAPAPRRGNGRPTSARPHCPRLRGRGASRTALLRHGIDRWRQLGPARGRVGCRAARGRSIACRRGPGSA